MKKLFRNTFCLLLAVSGLVACQEQEVEVFNTPSASFPGISVADRQIYTSYSDAYKAYNVVYSFATAPLGTEKVVIEIPLKLNGMPVDYDREVSWEVATQGTTAAKEHFNILDASIPAGEIYGKMRVEIIKHANLDNESDSVTVYIKDSKDLVAGPKEFAKAVLVFNNTLPGIPTASSHYYGTYNYFILSNSSKTAGNLKAYSPNAHKAILEAMGWPAGFWGRYNQSNRYDIYNKPYLAFYDALRTYTWQARLKAYLEKYEQEHGEPLLHNAGTCKGLPVTARMSDADKWPYADVVE